MYSKAAFNCHFFRSIILFQLPVCICHSPVWCTSSVLPPLNVLVLFEYQTVNFFHADFRSLAYLTLNPYDLSSYIIFSICCLCSVIWDDDDDDEEDIGKVQNNKIKCKRGTTKKPKCAKNFLNNSH